MIKHIKKKSDLKIKLPILAREKYLQIKSPYYGWFVDENFILPYFIDKRLIFKRMIFSYGLIPLKSNLTLNDEKKFLENVIDYITDKKLCDFIYKAQSNVIFNVCPKGSDCVEWGSYIVDLSLSEDEILKNMHAKHRNVIRKAIKDNVRIVKENSIKTVYEIIADTMKRQKVIFYPSLDFLKNLATNLSSNIEFFSAYKDDKIQGAAVFIYDEENAFYMYGGSIQKPYIGSLNLLHYEAMKYFKSLGVKNYDFVGARINFEKGSKYEGLDRFKKRFGGELKKGYTFRYVVNPLKFKLFNIISKNYLKLKGFNYIDPIDSIRGYK